MSASALARLAGHFFLAAVSKKMQENQMGVVCKLTKEENGDRRDER